MTSSRNSSGRIIVLFAILVVVVLVGVVFFLGGEPAKDSGGGNNTATGNSTNTRHGEGDTGETRTGSNRDSGRNSVPDRTGIVPTANALMGRVVDESGKPIAGATVSAEQGLSTLLTALQGEQPRFRVSTKTDRDGLYAFEKLPPYEAYIVTATQTGFAPAKQNDLQVFVDQATQVADLVLKPGATLRISVRDKESNPIADAAVEIEMVSKTSFFQESKDSDKVIGKTDSAGNRDFPNLSSGAVTVTVSAKGYATQILSRLNLSNDPPLTTKEIQLGKGLQIAGKVTDTNGRPVIGAQIEATSTSRQIGSKGTATSNVAGEFALEDLAEGSYILVVKAENYSEKRENRVTTGDTSVSVILSSQGSVAGRVLDSKTGNPIASFSLDIRRPPPQNNFLQPGKAPAKQFRAADGNYQMGGLDPGQSYVLLASAEGYASTTSAAFTVTGIETIQGIDISLSKGGSIRGVVLDAKTGSPVAGATVRTHENDYMDNPLSQVLGALLPPDPSKPFAQTGSDGAYLITHVYPGSYQIEVTSPGYSSNFLRDVRVAEDQTVEAGKISLNVGATVTGIVLDGSGVNMAGAQVSVRGAEPQSVFFRNTRADAQGRFALRNLPPGDYSISVTSADLANPIGASAASKKSTQTVSLDEGKNMELTFVVK